MNNKGIVFASPCLAIAIVLIVGVFVDQTRASDPRIEFELTDEPGSWFRNTSGGGSLAIAAPGTEVRFTGKSNTVHTRTSLIFPTGAANMPFDTAPRKGSDSVVLRTEGLYVFTCKIHPYMFGAVIVDANGVDGGLNLGTKISLVNGIEGVPTASDLAKRLLHTFFIATNPGNWKDYTKQEWRPSYPAVPVIVSLDGVHPVSLTAQQFTDALAAYDKDQTGATINPSSQLEKPLTNAVGEIWVDTQFEKTAGKRKPGTATVVKGDWTLRRKVALPGIEMNNPHNMWTDRNQTLIYQTQWFDTKLAVFDRETGRYINNIEVGESPSHVMTRVDSDQLHVALNGSTSADSVVELAPLANGVQRRINIGRGNPHAHWMSHDGLTMVTPNAFTKDSTQYSFASNSPTFRQAGFLPIATGMTPDSKKYYVANLLDSTITAIDMQTGATNTINLLAGYDPIGGSITGTEFGGALPIQTPVAPDNKSMVTANTLTGTIAVIDPSADKVVKTLIGDPGAHGVQYGAKQGGGYYAYVSNKFSNALLVVDTDPNRTGNLADAKVVGRILLAGAPASDDTVNGNAGMGGQGILTIPVVYNGWVQNLPQNWACKLSGQQLNPIGSPVTPPSCP